MNLDRITTYVELFAIALGAISLGVISAGLVAGSVGVLSVGVGMMATALALTGASVLVAWHNARRNARITEARGPRPGNEVRR